MPPIFVSHASKDDDTVTRLHDELEAATGRNLWVDHKDIPPGANWQIAIDQTLRETDTMLLVISRSPLPSRRIGQCGRCGSSAGRCTLTVERGRCSSLA